MDAAKTDYAKYYVGVSYSTGGKTQRAAKELPLVEVVKKADDSTTIAGAMTTVTTMGIVVAAAAALF